MMTITRGNSAGELWIATCGCLLLLVCWGLTYGMPVIFPFLADRFAVPVWHFAACFSIGGAIYFSIGSLAGAAADRYGTPIVVTVGSLISAAGFLIASLATSELVFAVGYIIGIGSGVGLTYAPVTAAVQVLTTDKKIVAAGITSAGIGFGSMLLPGAISWLYQISNVQVTLQAMAAFAVIGILPVLALKGVVQKAPPPTGVSALRTNVNFRWAFIGQVLFAIMFFVPFAHLVSISLWHGWTAKEGVELISLLGRQHSRTVPRCTFRPTNGSLPHRFSVCFYHGRRNDGYCTGVNALVDLVRGSRIWANLRRRVSIVRTDRVGNLRRGERWEERRHIDGCPCDRRVAGAMVCRSR
jgi:MFS family permease